jgi:branched-chain amino acid transport system permease protein
VTSLVLEVVAGLSTGSIYALLALGLTLIYQVSGVVNFAQGALAAVGAYALWSLTTEHGLPFWPAVILSLAVLFLLGVLIQALIIRRLERAAASSVIVTLGLLIVLEGSLGLIWGYTSPSTPLALPLSLSLITVGSLLVSELDLLAIAVTLVIMLAMFAFLRLTRAGAAVRAVAQSPQGARLVGIRVARVRLICWGVGAVTATAAGVLITTVKYTPLSPTMVEPYLLSAFAGAIIGGLDSLVGAAVGALLIGVTQNLVAFYISVQWKDAVVFLLLLAALLVRPAGLFGVAVQRRV